MDSGKDRGSERTETMVKDTACPGNSSLRAYSFPLYSLFGHEDAKPLNRDQEASRSTNKAKKLEREATNLATHLVFVNTLRKSFPGSLQRLSLFYI